MKEYRIYQAKVFDEKHQFIPAIKLDWKPTTIVYDDRDDALVKYFDMQTNDNENYYTVIEETR
jgi:hypothetical protein